MSHRDPMRHAIIQMSRFPGIGQRTAQRLVYWLLRQPKVVAEEIAAGIAELHGGMTQCSVCCNVSGTDPCRICATTDRDTGIVCVVERPQDVAAIEASSAHHGRYHVLNGAISPLDGIGPDQLAIQELLARVQAAEFTEIVVATDPDVEGDATALYLAALIKPLGIRVTRLAHGISVGTEIEYADKSSVARALENRREL
ncbi:MAG: recombination protein RecR [Oligoflexia bacterium]|nr:recombination protein RecR [Oligoflexia bacterium]